MGENLNKKELNLLHYLANGECYRLQQIVFSAKEKNEDAEEALSDIQVLMTKLKAMNDEAE